MAEGLANQQRLFHIYAKGVAAAIAESEDDQMYFMLTGINKPSASSRQRKL